MVCLGKSEQVAIGGDALQLLQFDVARLQHCLPSVFVPLIAKHDVGWAVPQLHSSAWISHLNPCSQIFKEPHPSRHEVGRHTAAIIYHIVNMGVVLGCADCYLYNTLLHNSMIILANSCKIGKIWFKKGKSAAKAVARVADSAIVHSAVSVFGSSMSILRFVFFSSMRSRWVSTSR